MTVRQQKYKQNRLAGMTQYNAARSAGYSHTYANQACRIEKLDNVRDLFEQAGLTDKAIVAHVKEALTATRPNGQPDWFARHKYLQTMLELTSRLAQAQETKTTQNIQVLIQNNVQNIQNNSQQPNSEGNLIERQAREMLGQ